MALLRCLRVQQRHRTDEILGLGDEADVGVDGPMIAAEVRLVALILLDLEGAVGVVLDKDAVSVGRALVLLVHVVVLLVIPLVGREELDFLLLVAWEDSQLLACDR